MVQSTIPELVIHSTMASAALATTGQRVQSGQSSHNNDEDINHGAVHLMDD